MKAFLFTIFALWYILREVSSQCNLDGGQTDKEFPDIFEIGKSGYEVSVEYTYEESNETTYVREYYSISDSDGRLEIWNSGDYTDYRYFNDSKEAFTFNNRNCTVETLENSLPPFLNMFADFWMHTEGIDDNVERYMYGPTAIFRKAYLKWKEDPTQVVFMDNVETVRSVAADRWQQCVDDQTLTYYFTPEGWKNPYGSMEAKVPLRATVKGIEKDTKNYKTLVYDFMDFMPYVINPTTTFMVMEGHGCSRLVENEIELPKYFEGNHFLRGEVVYYTIDRTKKKYSSYVSNFRLAIHGLSDIVSLRYAPWKTGSGSKDKPAVAKDSMTIIWDNKNKLLYEKNNIDGTCDIVLDSDYYPSFALPDEGDIDLLHPYLLINNTDFVYLGETKIRGIPAIIFERKLTDFYMGARNVPAVVITRYYAKEDTVISVGSDMTFSPLRINIAIYDDEYITQLNSVAVINIYSYTTDYPFYYNRLFDVSDCFRDYDQFSWFTAEFPIFDIQPSLVSEHRKEIVSEFLGFLYTHTEANPVRVPRVMVDVADHEFIVKALLLERPPYNLEFDQRDASEINEKDATFPLVSQDECKKACLEFEDVCKTISYCGSICYISKTEKAEVKLSEGCLTFDRTNIMLSVPTMDTLANNIKKIVDNGQFQISLEINNAGNIMIKNFLAEAFTYANANGDSLDKFSDFIRNRNFKIKKTGYKIKPDKDNDERRKYGQLSIEYCQNICKNNPECQAISYCFLKSECVISKKSAAEITNDMASDTQCVIFERNYLDSYRNYSGIIMGKTAEELITEKTVDECAKFCTEEKDFQCRSFDYCESTTQCLLHKTHFYDIKEKEGLEIIVSDTCSHFSKKYMYDFKMSTKRRISGNGDLQIRDINLEQCAQRCVENGGFQCATFDFCEGTEPIDNICILSSVPEMKTETISKPKCNHFSRDIKLRKPPPTEQENRYTAGYAAGIGILCFVIGGAIGLVGTFIFGYYRANRRT